MQAVIKKASHLRAVEHRQLLYSIIKPTVKASAKGWLASGVLFYAAKAVLTDKWGWNYDVELPGSVRIYFDGEYDQVLAMLPPASKYKIHRAIEAVIKNHTEKHGHEVVSF